MFTSKDLTDIDRDGLQEILGVVSLSGKLMYIGVLEKEDGQTEDTFMIGVSGTSFAAIGTSLETAFVEFFSAVSSWYSVFSEPGLPWAHPKEIEDLVNWVDKNFPILSPSVELPEPASEWSLRSVYTGKVETHEIIRDNGLTLRISGFSADTLKRLQQRQAWETSKASMFNRYCQFLFERKEANMR